ncbi:MAG: DUF2905 domain-containing protein [Verrucomicrobiota bacterium]|nr:DUF2905 domain-containing protein [Verrucomicrobiota bacterium]
MGRFFIIAGFLLLVLGILIQARVEIPWFTQWIGKLPGDITIKKGNATIYFPVTTSLLLSLLFTLLFFLFSGNRKT